MTHSAILFPFTLHFAQLNKLLRLPYHRLSTPLPSPCKAQLTYSRLHPDLTTPLQWVTSKGKVFLLHLSMFACNYSIKCINCINSFGRWRGKKDTVKHLLAFIQPGKSLEPWSFRFQTAHKWNLGDSRLNIEETTLHLFAPIQETSDSVEIKTRKQKG